MDANFSQFVVHISNKPAIYELPFHRENAVLGERLVDLKKELLPDDEAVSRPGVATVHRLRDRGVEAAVDEAANVSPPNVVHTPLEDAARRRLEDYVVGLDVKV